MTEHLPIQRWKKIFTRYPASEVLPNESGEYVTYADHLAALRACEERVISEGDEQSQIAYTTGYRHALDAAERAVAAIPVYRWPYSEPHDSYVETITVESALAAVTALRAAGQK